MNGPGPYSAYTVTTYKPGHADIAMPLGTVVLALRPGTVVGAGWDDGFGFNVLIRCTNGDLDRYAHFLANPVVTTGQRIVAQQAIGFSGNTGISTGPHLHIGSKDSAGNPIDPFRGGGGWIKPAAMVALAGLTLYAIAS